MTVEITVKSGMLRILNTRTCTFGCNVSSVLRDGPINEKCRECIDYLEVRRRLMVTEEIENKLSDLYDNL